MSMASIYFAYQNNRRYRFDDKRIPSYCDNGYVFDNKTNKCIEEICLLKEKEEEKNKEKGIAIFIASMVFFGLFLISLILYIITCRKGWDKSKYLFFIMIPFLLLGIILVMVATLKYDFS